MNKTGRRKKTKTHNLDTEHHKPALLSSGVNIRLGWIDRILNGAEL